MPIVKRLVRPVEIEYLCDACENGMMNPVGEMNAKTGEWPHQCLICEHRQVFSWLRYPRIEYLGEDEDF